MSLLGDEPINNEEITPEHISSSGSHSNNPRKGMMGGQDRGQFLDSSMEAASVSISVSPSVSDKNIITQQSGVDFNELVINTRQNLTNTLSVGAKLISLQARSFESAISTDGSCQFQLNDIARKYLVNMPHSLESILPEYPSSDNDFVKSVFLQPVVPHKSVHQCVKKSKYELVSKMNSLLDIPVTVDKRRHSFSENNEIDKSMQQTVIGDEPKRVLRKQVAIDVEEQKWDAGKASVHDVTVEDERRVLLHYNIDAYSLVKQHETVIRTPTVVLPKQGHTKYQGIDSNHNSGVDIDPLNATISNKTNFSSHCKRSQYLDPSDDRHSHRGLSSGSDDSTGTGSSREPSPFRTETMQAVFPYSKERFKTCTPLWVSKKQDRKEAACYDRHSSSGSSDAVFGPTFPEYCTNIVITSETGESVKCEAEDTNANEIPKGMHRRHVHPGNFKKHLHARYLKSLRSRYSSSSTDTSQERASQECAAREKSDSFSDVFDSSENDGMSKDVCQQPVSVIRYGSSDTGDDPDLQKPSVGKSSLLPHSGDQQPLDLSQSSCEMFPNDSTKQYLEAHRSVGRVEGNPHAFSSRAHLGHHAHSDPDLLNPLSLHSGSPSMFQWSPHLQSQHSQSPQSPLCSVPEGDRIFEFNFPSPFEDAHAHSDPEFGSPSPNSPKLHFTFPPRVAMLSTASEVNRLAVSPRAYYPNQISKSVPKQMSFGDATLSEQQRTASDSDAYICQVCGQVLSSYDSLARHIAKHLPTETIRVCDNSKIHYCKVCNRSFSRSDMLTRHMRLHTGLKPYECSDCSQVFSRSDHLNTHKRTHTGEKPYRCPQCPYAACRRDMITRHMRTHAKRSVKRSKYLSVPEHESHEIRKSSVSSTDTTSSQEMSRTFSASSADSLDLEVGNIVSPSKYRTKSASSDSTDMEIASLQPMLWMATSSESGVVNEKVHQKQCNDMLTHSQSFESPYENKKFISVHHFRQIQNLSSGSFESFESCEDVLWRTDSLAHDATKAFETGQTPKIVHTSSLPIEPGSM